MGEVWGAERVKIHLRSCGSLHPLNLEGRMWDPVCWCFCCFFCSTALDRIRFLGVYRLPHFKPSWDPFTLIMKARPVLEEHCSLFQSASGGLSGRLEEFKAFRESTKDFLQPFSCLAGSRNPSCVNC